MVMGIGRCGERDHLRASDRPDHVSSVRGDVHVTPGRHARHPPGHTHVALAPAPEATRTSSGPHWLGPDGPSRAPTAVAAGRIVLGADVGAWPSKAELGEGTRRPRAGRPRTIDPGSGAWRGASIRGGAEACGGHGSPWHRRPSSDAAGSLGLRSSQALARGRPRAPVRVIPPRFGRSPWAAGVRGRRRIHRRSA